MERTLLVVLTTILFGGAVLLAACNNTGLSEKPRASFVDLTCLDINGDRRINAGDATNLSRVPDFNADFSRDDDDAAFLRGVDIPLDPAAVAVSCDGGTSRQPEYLVAHEFLRSADVSCDQGKPAILVVGIGGGVEDLKDKAEAAGVRSIVNDMLKQYDDAGIQTIGIISGPAIKGAGNAHTAMEEWMTNVVRVHLERFPCARAVILGHSHGAVTAEVVGAHLEAEYGERIVAIVALDRIESLYGGDVVSRPSGVPVVNVYQRNQGELGGYPVDAPNFENINVSTEQGPKNGDKGGSLEPVTHVTIDNSKPVRAIIVDDVMRRSGIEKVAR
jgi:hypothetical protein